MITNSNLNQPEQPRVPIQQVEDISQKITPKLLAMWFLDRPMRDIIRLQGELAKEGVSLTFHTAEHYWDPDLTEA